MAKLKDAAGSTASRKRLRRICEILIHKTELDFKEQDFQRAHDVPFLNASSRVFGGLRILLDEQTPAERRPAAVARMRKYAGLEPGYKPITEILKQRLMEQMAKPWSRLSCANGDRD